MYKFHSLGKPAARVGDTHSCPMITPGTSVPHVGGPVIVAGCLSVFIEGRPAATKGDTCICVAESDTITTGSTGVFIEGKPAARMGDSCGHGGVIVSGSGTVWIGEVMGAGLLRLPASGKIGADFQEPSEEEKIAIIDQTIKDCIILLEKKLQLLEQDDSGALMALMTWFGANNDRVRAIITERIKSALNVCSKLTVERFKEIAFEKNKKAEFANVYPDDKLYRVFLGEPFWDPIRIGKRLRAGILAHELSHFRSVGKTVDNAYGKNDCLSLAKSDPEDALFNADSFEFFIEE